MTNHPTQPKRYILWYLKHIGKRELTCASDLVYTSMKEALNIGERMRDKGEILDYNVSVVYAPPLIGKNALAA